MPQPDSARVESGSPPRAWGQRADGPPTGAPPRFTPTCVGTTDHRSNGSWLSSVHPHVRGDNIVQPMAAQVASGSPPRAWGQRRRPLGHRSTCRFTPTCVGTTRDVSVAGRSRSVHPHVRGDNIGLRRHNIQAAGSPPRAWGQPFQRQQHFTVCRFTPTCVGTTQDALFALGAISVHPHVRGDNIAPSMWIVIHRGSPPRAWGQPPDAVAGEDMSRFTPTCVGTTLAIIKREHAQPVHPHVRGDNCWHA